MRYLFFLLTGLLTTAFFAPSAAAAEWREAAVPTEANLTSAVSGHGVTVAVGNRILVSPDTVHWHSVYSPAGLDLKQVVFDGERFWAVGRQQSDPHVSPNGGRLLRSADGYSWISVSVPPRPDGSPALPTKLNGFARHGDIRLAVGNEGTVLRSTDGLAWEAVERFTQRHLTAVAATGDGFAAFAKGRFFSSADGLEWTSREVEPGAVDEVVYAEDRFFGRTPEGTVWISGDGVIRLRPQNLNFSRIGRAAGHFYGIGEQGLWISRNLGEAAVIPAPADGLRAVAASGNRLVAVGEEGTLQVRDAGLWPPAIAVNPTRDRPVYPEGSRLSLAAVAVGNGPLEYQWTRNSTSLSGKNQTHLEIPSLTTGDAGVYSVKVTSPHGTAESGVAQIPVNPSYFLQGQFPAWHSPFPTGMPQPHAAVHGNGRFAVVGGSGGAGKISHSMNGVHWQTGELLGVRLYHRSSDVIFANHRFFMAAGYSTVNGRTLILHSDDGIAWSEAQLPENANGPAITIAHGNGAFVANYPAGHLWSPDGMAWVKVESNFQQHQTLVGTVAFGNGYFLIGTHNQFLRSVDGVTWEVHSNNSIPISSGQFPRLFYRGDRWWFWGQRIYFSPDGVLWMETDPLLPNTLNPVKVNGVWLANGNQSQVFYGNGAEWTNWAAPMPFSVLVEGGGRVVGLGESQASVRSAGIEPVILNLPMFEEGMGGQRAEGSSLILQVEAVGSGQLHYRWERDGVPIPGENGPELRIDNLVSGDSGSYRVRITNSHGRVLSNSVGVNVPPLLQASAPIRTNPINLQPSQVASLAYGNGRFMARGNNGFAFSTDGMRWRQVRLSSGMVYTNVVFHNGRFFAGTIGPMGNRVVHSLDGSTWESVKPPKPAGFTANPQFFALATGNGMLVAGGPGGVFWSEDGFDWHQGEGPVNLRHIDHGNGFFLGADGTSLYKSDDGRTWRKIHTPAAGTGQIRHAGNRWWNLTESRTFQSLDGKHWLSLGFTPSAPRFIDVLETGGFLLGFRANAFPMISANGADWAPLSDQTEPMRTAVAGGGRLVGQRPGQFFLSTRRDSFAPSFTLHPSLAGYSREHSIQVGGTLNLAAEAIGSGPIHHQWFKNNNHALPGKRQPALHIAPLAPDDGGQYHLRVSSPYGMALSNPISMPISLTPRVLDMPWATEGRRPLPIMQLPALAFGNGRFIAAGDDSIVYSRDGFDWHGGQFETTGALKVAAFGNGVFTAISWDRTARFHYSPDGAAWGGAAIPDGADGQKYSLTYGGGLFVAAGQAGTVLLSANGADWREAAQPPPASLAVAHGNGFFLSLAPDGSVFQSIDGEVWFPHGQVEPPSHGVRMKFTGNRFFLLDLPQYPLRHSFDGLDWMEAPVSGIEDIVRVGQTLLAIKEGGQSTLTGYGTLDATHWVFPHAFTGRNNHRRLALGNNRVIAMGDRYPNNRPGDIEPRAAVTTTPVEAVTGSPAALSLVPIGNPPFTFSWYRGTDRPEWIADTDGPVLEIPNVRPEDQGTYLLKIAGAAGASWSEPIHLVVHVPPAVTSQPGTVYANPGDTVRLSFEVSGSSPMTFAWHKNGEPAGQTSEPELVLPAATAADAGDYRMTVANAGGNAQSGPVPLRVVVDFADWTDWLRAAGVTEEELLAPQADPFGTGVPNLLAHALVLPPGAGRGELPQIRLVPDSSPRGGPEAVFTFQRRSDPRGVSLILEKSDDLRHWAPLDWGAVNITVEETGGVETVTLRQPLDRRSNAAQTFFRLRAKTAP